MKWNLNRNFKFNSKSSFSHDHDKLCEKFDLMFINTTVAEQLQQDGRETLSRYYCRLNDLFYYWDIKHTDGDWVELDTGYFHNVMINNGKCLWLGKLILWFILFYYSIILIDDALLLFELWLLNDMCGFSSPISSLEFGISVVFVANVHRLICLIARFLLWWVW